MMPLSQNLEAVPLVMDEDYNTSDNEKESPDYTSNRERFDSILPWRSHSSLMESFGWFVLAQLFLIAIYALVFLASARHWGPSQQCNSLVYTPAQDSLHYRKQRYDAELVIESDYIGQPTIESDHAWRDLIQNMNIAVPASDLEKIGASSIATPGQPGMYIAGLSVFHELHCLKRLRQYTWLDHYFPNQTAEEERLQRLHTDHCIDVLRQAILCHADASLFTLQWSEAEPMPRADFSHEHQCVDWDALNAWAAQRAIPDAIMATLKHPLHGAAFPDGKGSKLGASEDHSPTVHGDQ